MTAATSARASNTGYTNATLAARPEAFAGTHVAARADVIAQHPRLVVAPAGIRETTGTAQLHFEFEGLCGVDAGGRVVPCQLEQAR